MTDALLAAALALIGVGVLAIAAVCIAIRKGRPLAVSWRGFGVTFVVTPCVDCKIHSVEPSDSP